MEALKVMGDDFAVMQLKCLTCDACIMLHASLSSADLKSGKVTTGEIVLEETSEENSRKTKNASTKLLIDPEELKALRKHLKESGGSFMELFD